jgi:pimeloyl-ACP methyl ester carboxylesterase
MRKRSPLTFSRLYGALAVAFVTLLNACTSSVVTSNGASHSPSPSTSRAAGLVNIGGGRKIYLACRGTGSPTVILIAGGFEAGYIWNYALDPGDPALAKKYDAFSAGEGHPRKQASAVFPAVATFTRVCAYDRANTVPPEDRNERDGQISTPVSQPHAVQADVADLHALLNAAGETQPYVLVAHSYGGLIAELFWRTYPKDVSGLVLLDITSQFLKQTETPQEFRELQLAGRKAQNGGGERLELGGAIDAVLAAPGVPAVPTVVILADKRNKGTPAALIAHIHEAGVLLAKHLDAKLITQTNSGHHLQNERPQLVVSAIRHVVDAARTAAHSGS